jgi:nucleoside-triphosphatase THEP1
MQLVEQARNLGLDVAGLISPAVFDNGQKVQIDLLDLATGTRRSLAIRKVEKDDNLVAGAWGFDPEALEWGNAQLGAIRHCQLLVVDELGPLEFQNHTGWMNAFPLIESRCYRLACLVVRPELLHQALERWPWAEVMELPARVGAG